MTGVATASLFADPISHSHLFGSLIEQLASSIPEQLRSYEGNYESFRLDLPQDPLCVTTVIMENEDGSLIPRVSNKEYEETQ